MLLSNPEPYLDRPASDAFVATLLGGLLLLMVWLKWMQRAQERSRARELRDFASARGWTKLEVESNAESAVNPALEPPLHRRTVVRMYRDDRDRVVIQDHHVEMTRGYCFGSVIAKRFEAEPLVPRNTRRWKWIVQGHWLVADARSMWIWTRYFSTQEVDDILVQMTTVGLKGR